MRSFKRRIVKIGKLFLFTVCLLMCFGIAVSGADDFQQTLKEFPESYRPYLEQLHKKYPEWVFVPFETGLEWSEVVDEEYGEISLVQESASSDLLKSHDSDDYNPQTDKYIQKDGGFVQASRLAVEYFIDPRNFLNESGIFQFELLSFSDIFTVEAVDAILRNSFMYNKKISYLNSAGELISTQDTYAQVIYNAGKTYNINPCYLASKILNEVGSDGSYSVWGDHPTYPGIYNFYNIGATDGSGAIARGLLWASGGSSGSKTYLRPWNTPEKSIMGGASFLASSYISLGQFTGYLQRFNVNPDAYHKVYTHQYMTNLTGAVSQGYSTYASYVRMGLINNAFVFSIPIFENMPEATDEDKLTVVDSYFQYGKININGVNVRTGPSDSYAKLQSSTGASVSLPMGTQVRILSKHFVDSDYYSRILRYPVWYYVSFTYNSQTLKGYVLGDYVSLDTVTYVSAGKYDMGIFATSSDSQVRLMSNNSSVCQIIDADTVEFLKAGEVCVSFYNSTGLYDCIRFIVSDKAEELAVRNMTVSSTDNSITVSLARSDEAERYSFYLKDSKGSFVKGGDITSSSYTFKNLKPDSEYTVYCRYVADFCFENGPLTHKAVSTKESQIVTAPYNLSVSGLSSKGYTLSWSCDTDADGYRIYRYCPEIKNYIVYGNVTSTSEPMYELEPGYLCGYRIKAYKKIAGKYVFSDYSPFFTALNACEDAAVPEYELTDDGIRLKWNASRGATAYKLYMSGADFEDKLIYEGSGRGFTFKNPEQCSRYSFSLVSEVSKNGITVSGKPSAALIVDTPLEPVTALRLSHAGADKLHITWAANKKAESYNIYLYDTRSKKYTLRANVDTTSAVIDKLIYNKEYKLAVCALGKIQDSTVLSEMSFLTASTVPDSVSGFTLKNVTESGYLLGWDKLDFAVYYTIYLKDESGKFKRLLSTTNPSHSFKGLESSSKAHYYVTASYYGDELIVESQPSEIITAATIPDTPENLKGTVYESSVRLTWSSVPDADCYSIFLYENGAYTLKGTVKTTSFTLTGLKDVTSYYVRVRAYIAGSFTTQRSGLAGYKFTTMAKRITSVTASSVTDTSYVLSWKPSSSAVNMYYVYRYDKQKKAYTRIASTAATKITLTGLEPGTTCTYSIMPVIIKNGKQTGRGYTSADFSFSTHLGKTQKLSAGNISKSSLTLSWSKTQNATYYRIYRYDTATKSYTQIGSSKTNSFTVEGLRSGTKYYYKVRPIRYYDGRYYYGYYSDLFSVSTLK